MKEVKILIVDDDTRIRDMIKEYFSLEDFSLAEAANGVEAMKLIENNEYSLIILDVMMPMMDGWQVCKNVRKTSNVPIIMLTARGEEYDKLLGFELGVDDYITKPFSPRELIARIKAILRRNEHATTKKDSDDRIQIGGIHIDFSSRNVSVDKKSVSLTPKEYELLTFLIRNQNRVFSRNQLLDSVWGYDFVGEDRTVDTHVKMLRESLGPYRDYIVTVWGIGYKFEIGGLS